MSSITRPLVADDVLHVRLADETFRLTHSEILARSGRSARTLLKDGSLRVTLIGLAAGQTIAEHHADGPLTIQTLHGRIRVLTSDDAWELDSGSLLSLAAGVRHSVETHVGGVFLLTLINAPAT